jgi:hypothetical protein
MKSITLFFLTAMMLVVACKKDSVITSPDARLSISADTLKFDTVFTSAGSVTQFFKIINENNQRLILSSVTLMGGAASSFKMNVDGIASNVVNDVEIAANDSIYVFVQVNVDPAAGNIPFVIRDSIQVSFNGNEQLLQLEAWGQNAHYLRDKEIVANETWNNDLPYVILGYLRVNAPATLTINKGCRIYVHADAPLIIDGSLKVNGLKDTADRVYFSGDRLDQPYANYPASWPGIYFGTTSIDNVLNFAVIRNSYQSVAVVDPSFNANPKLVMNECVIDNSYDAGIIASNSSVSLRNCLVSNCGRNVVLLGGSYSFEHCTIVSYSNTYILHREPVLQIRNADALNVTRSLNTIFKNCILWGANGTPEQEIVVEKAANTGATPFTVNFSYNLWKVESPPAEITTNLFNINSDPLFDSIDASKPFYNFRLKTDPVPSPAINKGINSTVTIDLDGNPRPVGLPDLGCFEKQ